MGIGDSTSNVFWVPLPLAGVAAPSQNYDQSTHRDVGTATCPPCATCGPCDTRHPFVSRLKLPKAEAHYSRRGLLLD